MAFLRPPECVENAAVSLLSRPRVIDGFPAWTSLLRLAEPTVVKGRVLILLVEEMPRRDEVPRRRTAFGRRSMVADARWYGETWWKEEAVGQRA
jgi:hypothetical protein